MNYKEFQKRQQGEAKNPVKKTNWDLLEFLSEASGLVSLLAVISMIIFWKNLPIIPAFFSLLTAICFFIRYKKDKCLLWLSVVWAFNTIIWLLNSLTKLI